MPLSQYIYSRFIRALLQNGYNGTLVTLLHDMDLDKLICDTDAIANLLISRLNRNTIDNVVKTIDIENAIIVFDELSAPKIIVSNYKPIYHIK